MRRQIVAGLLLAVTIVGAQSAERAVRVHRLAVVDPVIPAAQLTKAAGPSYSGFFEELHRLGYIEGQNILIERFSGEGRADHYPEVVRDVIDRDPDVIFANSTRLVLEFKVLTSTIPIVTVTPDPVRLGIVASLARPGANITGVAVDAGAELFGKRLELLKQAVPNLSKVGILASRPVWEKTPVGTAMQNAAQVVGIAYMWPSDGPLQEAEYRRAFEAMTQEGVNGVIVLEQNENWTFRQLIIDLAEKARLPTIWPATEGVEIGGFMSYGIDWQDIGRRIAGATDQILKGKNPNDIPIQQPTAFHLSINLKTAKTLGIGIPSSVLIQADKVIE
jgi:putative ABC transport system substrate-binding protein